MSKVKFMDKVRTYGTSMEVPLVIIMTAAALIPLFLQAVVMPGSSNQGQLDARTTEIQNQCVTLSNKMTCSGYMMAGKRNNTAPDNQMQAISDVYNGRTAVVNPNSRAITDTFNFSIGELYISEEVIKCLKGENSSHHSKGIQYLAQTIPVYDPVNEKNTYGVIAVTAPAENILPLTDEVMGKSNLFLVFICLAMGVLAAVAVHILMRPFKKFQLSFSRVAQGDLDADITENTYRRTIQLLQAVQRSLSKLKAADQSRQELVSDVSHEPKTPITSIRVLADSLMGMEKVPTELYRELMTDISDETDQENQIIEDLLILVKMGKSAESQMNIEQVNTNRELESVLKRLHPITKRGDVELALESIREVTADVDRVKISLAITNPVESAIECNRGSGNVRVTLDANHKYFYVKVTDIGIDIPEDALEHVFERLFRVDKARSREAGGTGLGLAIVKNVIQMHHGIIDVESMPGEGTTFNMRIPSTYVLQQEVKL